MIKRIFLMICILMMLITAGCRENKSVQSEDETKTIAFSIFVPTHAWPGGVWYYAQEEVQKVAEENGWEYVCLQGEDANVQSNQLIDLVEQGVDCIILLPMDGASLKTAAKVVQKADIPLIIFDREIPDLAPAATVKGDNTGIGTETARVFNEYFPNGTKVLELMGDTSTVPFQRTAGYDEMINDNFSKVQLGYTGWQRDQSREIFEEWVEKSTQEEIDEIEAIFTHDDEIALGVLDALDAYQADPEFDKTFDNLKVIASSAGSQEMYKRIAEEDEYYLFSLTYAPTMVKTAVRIAEKIIKEEPYDEMTIIPTTLIDQSNVGYYIDDSLPF